MKLRIRCKLILCEACQLSRYFLKKDNISNFSDFLFSELQINKRSYELRFQSKLTGTFYALGESGYLQVTGTYQVIDPIT